MVAAAAGNDGIGPASESRCHVEGDGMAFAKALSGRGTTKDG